MMIPEYAYITRFAARKGGHGGNRRTRQMAELFSEIEVKILDVIISRHRFLQ